MIEVWGFGCCRGGMTLCGCRLAGSGVGRVAFSCLSVSCVVSFPVVSLMGKPRRQVVYKAWEILVGLDLCAAVRSAGGWVGFEGRGCGRNAGSDVGVQFAGCRAKSPRGSNGAEPAAQVNYR